MLCVLSDYVSVNVRVLKIQILGTIPITMDITVKNNISTYAFNGLAENGENGYYMSRNRTPYANTSSETDMFDFGESCKYIIRNNQYEKSIIIISFSFYQHVFISN